MEAPSHFTSTLEREFQGRLRIRWSPTTGVWMIEERVGRATFEIPYSTDSDMYERVKDGYSFVMSIAPSDTVRCPHCNTRTPAPFCETAEAICPKCPNKFRAAFYPLNHLLIRWLKKIDPLRTVEFEGTHKSSLDELCAGADSANLAREAAQARATHNAIESSTLDNWKDLADIGRSTKPR